jgi:DNA helicase-2/ATP-dependent DNA helicase PcrA
VSDSKVALTPEQEELVALREGSFLVLAPPGAGKTEVIAQRVVRLLAESQESDFRVLALTFNNRAASSMRARVVERLGGDSWRATVETYHAFYLGVLRNYGAPVGVPPEVTVYDTDDARVEALAQGLEDEGLILGRDAIDRQDALAILTAISALKRNLTPAAAAEGHVAGIALQQAFAAYDRVLIRNGAIDFDSVLSRAYELLTQRPQVAKHYRRIYKYILVDEAQDTSSVQFELLRALCGDEHRNVFMVADPDQLINRWLGADQANLERFKRDFNAAEYKLSTNFRCSDAVVSLANKLLRDESGALGKPIQPCRDSSGWVGAASFRTAEAEAEAAVGWLVGILENGLDPQWLAPGESTVVQPSQAAVLARSRLQLSAVLEALDAQGISYAFRTGDTGPFETPLYRCLLDAMRVKANPRDVAIRRTLVAATRPFSDATQVVAPADNLDAEGFLGAVAQSLRGDLRRLMERMASAADMAAALAAVATPTDAEAVADPQAELLRLDRELLQERWRQYSVAHESRAWDWSGVVMALTEEPKAERTGVRVCTVHAAKGLEFRAVALVGFNEGSFPDFRNVSSVDELAGERRLAYVAMTRAARALFITRPRSRRTRYGNVRAQEPSRFLVELGLPEEAR